MAEGMKKCPFCAEEIRAEALVCRFCNRDLQKPTLAPPSTPNTSEVVQRGVALDATRRTVQGEVRRRRFYARILAFFALCVFVAAIALMSERNPKGGLVLGMFVASGVLGVAHLVMKPRFTGAECPHCRGFAVRRVTRSGCFSASQGLHCDDCLADFAMASRGCVLIGAALIGALALANNARALNRSRAGVTPATPTPHGRR